MNEQEKLELVGYRIKRAHETLQEIQWRKLEVVMLCFHYKSRVAGGSEPLTFTSKNLSIEILQNYCLLLTRWPRVFMK